MAYKQTGKETVAGDNFQNAVWASPKISAIERPSGWQAAYVAQIARTRTARRAAIYVAHPIYKPIVGDTT